MPSQRQRFEAGCYGTMFASEKLSGIEIGVAMSPEGAMWPRSMPERAWSASRARSSRGSRSSSRKAPSRLTSRAPSVRARVRCSATTSGVREMPLCRTALPLKQSSRTRVVRVVRTISGALSFAKCSRQEVGAAPAGEEAIKTPRISAKQVEWSDTRNRNRAASQC